MFTKSPSVDMSLKPRVLIADDSRIVRATLIKHIQGMFEFREALDGEHAWETLLLDPSIRVLITDLTMPKLDGYGLLERIRKSKISRIRNMPVVVVSGSDEQEERDRAKAAGATDLITKGIGTAQLLSRLDILSKLVSTQQEYERSLEALAESDAAGALSKLSSPYALRTQAETMLANSIRHNKNFVLLSICLGLKKNDPTGSMAMPPESVVNAIGQLLYATVRQTDSVAKTGDAEFTLVTGGVNLDSARNFAERLCRAISNANLLKDEQTTTIVASCGLVSLCQHRHDSSLHEPALNKLWDIAHRRGALGLRHGLTGVVSSEEEASFLQASN